MRAAVGRLGVLEAALVEAHVADADDGARRGRARRALRHDPLVVLDGAVGVAGRGAEGGARDERLAEERRRREGAHEAAVRLDGRGRLALAGERLRRLEEGVVLAGAVGRGGRDACVGRAGVVEAAQRVIAVAEAQQRVGDVRDGLGLRGVAGEEALVALGGAGIVAAAEEGPREDVAPGVGLAVAREARREVGQDRLGAGVALGLEGGLARPEERLAGPLGCREVAGDLKEGGRRGVVVARPCNARRRPGRRPRRASRPSRCRAPRRCRKAACASAVRPAAA